MPDSSDTAGRAPWSIIHDPTSRKLRLPGFAAAELLGHAKVAKATVLTTGMMHPHGILR